MTTVLNFKPECRDRGFCWESDCEYEDRCPYIDGVREECMCGVCMDRPPGVCLCRRCDIYKNVTEDCDWREECGYAQDADARRERVRERG